MFCVEGVVMICFGVRHEAHDVSASEPEVFNRMKTLLQDMRTSKDLKRQWCM